jgi:hypothetical protein
MRKTVFAALVAGLALVGCEAAPTTPTVEPDLSMHGSGDEEDGARWYRVTVYNLTSNQPLTPPLIATHEAGMRFFNVGHPASPGIKEIAENGNLPPMAEALMAKEGVSDVVIAVGDPPPLLQGGSITVEIHADGDANFLSWISMLISTNDGFAGRNLVRLPPRIGQVRSVYAGSYDAGTETNTEDFADMVPPCQLLGATSSDDEGTGMSDPALAEDGRIHPHRGIQGGEDLEPDLHGWTDPVAKVEIERIS